MPTELVYIWEWFVLLHTNRTSNGFGVNPITYQDMWFFFQLEGIEPQSWELELIKRFDIIFLEHVAKKQMKEQSKNKQAK